MIAALRTESDLTRVSKKSSQNLLAIVDAPAVDEDEDLELTPLIPAEWELDLVHKPEYRRFVESCLDSLLYK